MDSYGIFAAVQNVRPHCGLLPVCETVGMTL